MNQPPTPAATPSVAPRSTTTPDSMTNMTNMTETTENRPHEATTRPAHTPQAGETILIVNRGARLAGVGAYDAEALERGLRDRGLDAYLCETTSAKETVAVAKRAAEVGAEMVVAVGGDGTIHTVIDGLLRGLAPELVGQTTTKQATKQAMKAPQGMRTVLGIIPAGTMNNVGSALGIPEDTTQALNILGAGATRPLDVGLLDGHPFIEVAGFGVVAGLMPLGERVKGRPWAVFAVISAVIDILRRARPSRVRLVLDGEGRWVRALQITVSNTPSYGARFAVAPEARTDDGLLDVTALIGINGGDVVRRLFALVGFHVNPRDWRVRRFQARRVVVQPQSPWPSQVDGVHYCEMWRGTDRPSLEARVIHGVLRVCAPPGPLAAEPPEGAMQTLMRALPFPTPKPTAPASEPQEDPLGENTNGTT